MASEPENETNWDELRPQIIKMALEVGPLVVFFLVNFKGEDILASSPFLSGLFGDPIFFATAIFMVAMTISLVLSWLLLRRIASFTGPREFYDPVSDWQGG